MQAYVNAGINRGQLYCSRLKSHLVRLYRNTKSKKETPSRLTKYSKTRVSDFSVCMISCSVTMLACRRSRNNETGKIEKWLVKFFLCRTYTKQDDAFSLCPLGKGDHLSL